MLKKPLHPQPSPRRYLGLDIEAQHGATWGEFNGRMFFGAAMRFEGGEMKYLAPGASKKKFGKWIKDLLLPGVVVVAHNGTYDLNGLNGESMRLGLGSLPPVLLSDTLRHLPRNGQMFGKSLADLCKHYGIPAKTSILRTEWEAAYRGDKVTLKKVREYNENDVDCVLALRSAEQDDGILGPPRLWKPQ